MRVTTNSITICYIKHQVRLHIKYRVTLFFPGINILIISINFFKIEVNRDQYKKKINIHPLFLSYNSRQSRFSDK